MDWNFDFQVFKTKVFDFQVFNKCLKQYGVIDDIKKWLPVFNLLLKQCVNYSRFSLEINIS